MGNDTADSFGEEAFTDFVIAYQEALAGGRPLPDADRLPADQRRRWEGMRGLLHRLQHTDHPTSLDPSRSGPARLMPGSDPEGRTVAFGPDREPVVAGDSGSGLPAVPGYQLLEEVGRGGMGVVYKARHRALNRLVALKMVLAAELATPEQLLRFQLEAELAARVQHPNVVHVHEVGRWRGRPFLAMEWVEGGTLAQKIRAGRLPPREAAELVVVLARAVHAAHCQGVIHRDLKPANVLLTAEGQPRIADFGLAKPITHAPGLTTTGAVVGTPEYMAPEQAGGDGRHVGPSCDVHALGAILYELLTDRPPFRGTGFLQTVELVCEAEPAPPRSIVPHTPRDLETVCLKCLRKEPESRYPTALALAEDLQAFLAGKPISARPVGRGERAWRWARRHPAVASLLGCVAALLVGGSLVSAWFGLDARRQAWEANQAREAARTAETAAQHEKRTAELRAAEQTFRLGLQEAEAGAVDRGLFLMLRAWREAPEDAVAFRTVIRANLAGWSRQMPRLRQAVRVGKTEGPYQSIVSGDPEGRTFLAWLGGQGVRCFDSSNGRPIATPPYLEDKSLRSASPDGRWLGVSDAKGFALFDRANGEEVPGSRETLVAAHVPFSGSWCWDLPDVFPFERPEGQPCFWDLRTGKEVPTRLRPAREDTFRLTRTSDGRPAALVIRGGWLPAHRRDLRMDVIDLSTGKTLGPPPPLAAGPSPVVGYDGRAAILEASGAWTWIDLASHRPQDLPWRTRRAGHSMLSRDALQVLCQEGVGHYRVYDLATGLQRGGELIQPNNATGTTSPDGRLLFTLASDGTARAWDTSLCRLQPTPSTIPRRRLENRVESADEHASYSADGRRVALIRRSHDYALLLDGRTGELLGPPLRQSMVELAVFSPDGRYLATAPNQGDGRPGLTPMVVLRDGRTGEPIGQPWLAPKLIHALAFSPDGKLLAVGGVAGTFILDVPANTLRHTLREATCIGAVQWNADSRRLLVTARPGWAGVGPGLRVWDARAGEALGPFRPAQDAAWLETTWLAGHADAGGNEGLAFCDIGKPLLLRLSADGKEERGTLDLAGPAQRMGFSADGGRMVASTSSNGNNLRQWDIRTGKAFGLPLRHPESAQLLRYSPDARVLAVACLDETVRLWDADSGWPLGPLLTHTSAPVALAFTEECRTLSTITEAGFVHSWAVPQPVLDDADRFETWVRARCGLRMDGEEPAQVSVEEWQAACRHLGQRWPQADPALEEPSDDLAPWHRLRALDAAAVGNERGELYHLTRLAELCPREEAVRARIASVHARVAGRLPAGPPRDREWHLAQDAARWEKSWPGEGHWAHRGALEATARKSFGEALWYLDRLTARDGGDWTVFADRAEVHAKQGDSAACDADLNEALWRGGRLQRDFALRVAELWSRRDRWDQAVGVLSGLHKDERDASVTWKLALALLKAGDHAGHARLCQDALRGLPPRRDAGGPLLLDFSRIVTALRATAWSAQAVDDWEQPLALLDAADGLLKAGEGKGGNEQALRPLRRELLTAKGAVLHRAGRHADAVAQLEQAMKLAPGGEGGPEEWAWLALAHAATEKVPGEATRRWLDRARAAMPKRDGGLWEAVGLELLVAEASRAVAKSERK